ncbi:hypothetical protein [Cohnella zeiphila]|uniref:Uncharacterized protein n=1 Tax=Cohnella zeiphila TaxID=2761120 RepID=A0A7X0STS6_9BACL|nr:hypothetical protein [Cohnella zeiphila]MBB6735987.1 hypothetical protein [Cohnella zeiphila]
MRFVNFAVAALLLAGGMALPAKTSASEPVWLSVRASPRAVYEAGEAWNDAGFGRALAKAETAGTASRPELTDLYVRWNNREFRAETSGDLWEEQTGRRLVLPPDQRAKLGKEAKALRGKLYGERISWTRAKQIMPRKSFLTVRDIESGLFFRVQHRAGRDHADVQPVSKQDTAVMKEIYGGAWSWRRRAIVVEAGGGRWAASMNGMPHGGDGIPGNGFSGHFCIHFDGSSTHRSEEPDPAHRMMIYKAAGQPRAFLQTAEPAQLAQSLVEAMNQHDGEWVRLLLEGVDRTEAEQAERLASRLVAIRLVRLHISEKESGPLTALGEAEADWQQEGGGKRSSGLTFRYVRPSPLDPWRLDELVLHRA